MARLFQSLAEGLDQSDTLHYVWLFYRVAILVVLTMIAIIQIEVHLASLQGTGVAETVLNLGELLRFMAGAIVVMWLIEVAFRSWRVYSRDSESPQEVTSIE